MSVDPPLSAVEIRVIGSLIEKQFTTPESYPLSLNSLVIACNQTTNRDPVTSYDEGTVGRALESLRVSGLAWVVRGGRVPKYEHRFGEKFELARRELAAMCVLMLRGAQTPGEIRGRTGRLHEFADLAEVEASLDLLTKSDPRLVVRLPRVPGTKEARFVHLLAGEAPAEASAPPGAEPIVPPGAEPIVAGAGDERIARLEGEIEALRQEVHELRRELAELKNPTA
jgi:uncharacterized protein YceH (UPF0502 family)